MTRLSKISKRVLLTLLVFSLSLALVACGGGGGAPAPEQTGGDKQSEAPKETAFLNIATSTAGGTFYPVGGKLADMISKNISYAQATAQVTAGGVENVRLLKNKEAELAMMPGDTLHNAIQGTGEFTEDGPQQITQLAALFPSQLHIVTVDSTGIESIADLKGKRVSLGAPGSSTAIRAEIVLNAHGITLDDIKVDWTTSGEAANQILDGQIDAGFFTSGAPQAAIMDIAAKRNLRLLGIEQDVLEKIEQEHPVFAYVIPGGIYPGVDEDVPCVADMTILVCRPDLDEDLIYDITKMMWTEIEDFKSAHGVLEKNLKLENAMAQEKLAPFHPGALKYYKEVGLVD